MVSGSGANVKPTFSLDSDFDELIDKDRTVELVGFICSVQAPTLVGNQVKYNLFKFSISNGGNKKIQCLIWGLPLIEQHKSNIVINAIVHIDGAHCKASRLPHNLEVQGYCPFEIIIQANTVMKFFGIHESVVAPIESLPTAVTFENINRVEGKISIDGYVKTKFTSIPSRFENASYGCGSITDGEFKITLNISNYVPVELERGDAVNVIDEFDPSNNGPCVIACKSMSCITKRENVAPMPEATLMRGVKNIKRRAPPA